MSTVAVALVPLMVQPPSPLIEGVLDHEHEVSNDVEDMVAVTVTNPPAALRVEGEAETATGKPTA